MQTTDLEAWERRFEAFLEEVIDPSDPAHDLAHTRRVVATARRLAEEEDARLEVVLPAAWLHDCVVLPKNDPRRREASRLAGERAEAFLRSAGYEERWLSGIRHAIEAHSFSAGLPPETLEARIVQDADRLDALGAVGIARCFTVGGQLARPLSHPTEIFPEDRPVDDRTYTIDHFFAKLLTLASTMQTDAGRREGRQRTDFMRLFLDRFRAECDGTGRDPEEANGEAAATGF